jgi:ubiquinone/menaquinone biosynthesis C-methylase UbiE
MILSCPFDETSINLPVMGTYTHGHHESVLRSHSSRTAGNSAAYLLGSLAPHMSLLDVGCGPGTITCDLAARVATVTGIDMSTSVLAQAAQGAPANVTFEQGDAYALRYPDGSFDVVHAHQVLQHLTDPVRALREMGRVARRGGIVAARDSDYQGWAWYPELPELDQWLDLYLRVARANGGEPAAGRRMLHWARQAGFTDVTATSSTWCYADEAARAFWGGMWAERITRSAIAEQAVALGFAVPADLERMAAGWRAWAGSPDGWISIQHGEILCRAG